VNDIYIYDFLSEETCVRLGMSDNFVECLIYDPSGWYFRVSPYQRRSLHSLVHTLIAAVPRVTLKGTFRIVAIFVFLCVTDHLILNILCQN